ncbi:MAG: hypothetical protein IPH08_05860 [Rhodocyclaceae bacterium]|nr:hypothetical protein [Rhodocyclaceae bacterium]MBK6906605.1 hypothetical protein [Rhodocyclaceae bacterium]
MINRIKRSKIPYLARWRCKLGSSHLDTVELSIGGSGVTLEVAANDARWQVAA